MWKYPVCRPDLLQATTERGPDDVSSPSSRSRCALLPALGARDRVIKRALDLSLGLVLLSAALPVMFAIAIAIRIETPGAILFRQKRWGYLGQQFEIWKFRSFYDDFADSLGHQLTQRGDSRVTIVGAFLRRWSLDELPQLVHVVTGHMSLVGPRPHPLEAKAGTQRYDQLIPSFNKRYSVRPGLTGLAQIQGLRGTTETREQLVLRFHCDCEYIRRWSLWRDLAVLFATPRAVWNGENAF